MLVLHSYLFLSSANITIFKNIQMVGVRLRVKDTQSQQFTEVLWPVVLWPA